MKTFSTFRSVLLGSFVLAAAAHAQQSEVSHSIEAEPPVPCAPKNRPCAFPHFAFALEGGGGAFEEGSPFGFGAGTGSGTSPGPSWGVRAGFEFTKWLAVDAHYVGMLNLINKDYAPTGPVRLITNGVAAELRLTLPTPYVQPYILGGIGYYATSVAGTTDHAREGTAFHASAQPGIPMGVGFTVPLSDHFSLGAEATYHYFRGEAFSDDEAIEGGDLTTFNAVLRFRI